MADLIGVGAVASLAETVIGKIWPDKSAQEQAQLAAALALVQGQLDVNKAEAGSSSRFTSGWRPAIGWVCGAACAWNWVFLPVAKIVLELLGHHIPLSAADTTEMMPILTAMLGLGGYRTFEKVNGAAK